MALYILSNFGFDPGDLKYSVYGSAGLVSVLWGMFVPLFQQVTEHVRFSLLFLPCLLLVVIPTSIRFGSHCCAPWVCTMCVTPSARSGTWAGLHPVDRFSEPSGCSLGSDPCVHSSGASTGLHPQFHGITFLNFFLSFHDFPQGNLSCSQAPPSCPLTRQPRLQFPGSVGRFLNLCLLLGPTSERSERATGIRLPLTLLDRRSLWSERRAPCPLGFRHSLSDCCLCVTVALPRGWDKRERGKKTDDFSQSFWPLIGHFPAPQVNRCIFCLHPYVLPDFRLPLSPGWEKWELKEKGSSSQFSDSQRDPFTFPIYHFLFKVLGWLPHTSPSEGEKGWVCVLHLLGTQSAILCDTSTQYFLRWRTFSYMAHYNHENQETEHTIT